MKRMIFEKKIMLLIFLIFISFNYNEAIMLRSINVKIDCVNGRLIKGRCFCDGGFSGKYCDIKMKCQGLELMPNGSCTDCEEGWSGANCDLINCGKNGISINNYQCKCSKPYSGQFCDKLEKDDVYSFYNRRMYNIGPIGVLAVIPMYLIITGCQKYAKRRQIIRVKKQLQTMQRQVVKEEVVEKLLEEIA